MFAACLVLPPFFQTDDSAEIMGEEIEDEPEGDGEGDDDDDDDDDDGEKEVRAFCACTTPALRLFFEFLHDQCCCLPVRVSVCRLQ